MAAAMSLMTASTAAEARTQFTSTYAEERVAINCRRALANTSEAVMEAVEAQAAKARSR